MMVWGQWLRVSAAAGAAGTWQGASNDHVRPIQGGPGPDTQSRGREVRSAGKVTAPQGAAMQEALDVHGRLLSAGGGIIAGMSSCLVCAGAVSARNGLGICARTAGCVAGRNAARRAALVRQLGGSQRWCCGWCGLLLLAGIGDLTGIDQVLSADPGVVHIDHIVPASRGGPDARWNLQVLHPLCNSE